MIKKINELELAVKALLQAIKEYEANTMETVMPEGEYLGVKFNE